MNKIAAFIKIIRPLNVFQSWIAILITATLLPTFPPFNQIYLTALVVGFFLAAGNAINDYFDYDTDKTNRPNRPLSQGVISPGQALFFAFLLFVSGTSIFFALATKISALLLAVNMILLIIYTPFLKPTVLLGNLAVSYLLGSTFLFGAEIFGDITKGIVPCILAFMFNFARELNKDIEDVQGDKEQGIKTFPVKYGIEKSKRLSYLLISIIIIVCIIPYLTNFYGKFYLVSVILTVEIPLLMVLYLLQNSKQKRDFARISNLMKILVFCGLLSIYLGKF